MNEPTEQNRGWFFPVAVVNLYLARKINAEEMVLLGIINAHQDRKRGCFASNAYLAEKWGKHLTWVSTTISKLTDLGLLRITRTKAGQNKERHIWVTYQGDHLDPLRENSKPPLEKTLSPLRENSKQNNTRVNNTQKESGDARTRAARTERSRASGNGLILHQSEETSPHAKLTKKFHNFIIENRFHLGKRPPNLTKWRAACESMIDHLHGNVALFREVMNWYLENHRSPWVGTYHSMPTFCENFTKVQKAMLRAQADHRNKPEPPPQKIYAVDSDEEFDRVAKLIGAK